MNMLTLLLLLAQAQGQSASPQLPPDVVQAVLRAAERVAAIAQGGILCQAVVTTDRDQLAALRKDRLETDNKRVGLRRAVTEQTTTKRGTRINSAEWKAADASLDDATALVANASKYRDSLLADEKTIEARLRKQEACVDTAQKQLDEIKIPKKPG